MKPVLYLYRSCTSCRNAAAILREHGVEFEEREFFKTPFSREELESVLKQAGVRASDLISTRSAVYRNEKMAEQELSDDALLDRMLKEPRLIRRPILVTDDRVQVGFDRSRLEKASIGIAGKSPS